MKHCILNMCAHPNYDDCEDCYWNQDHNRIGDETEKIIINEYGDYYGVK